MRFAFKETLVAATGALAVGAAVGRLLLDSMNDADAPSLAALAAHADREVAGAAEPRRAPLGETGVGVPGAASAGGREPRRLVLVVLDGLGETAFGEALAHTEKLGEWSFRATVDVGTPSLSRPVYHVLLTGVPQDVSGIRNNAHVGPARADDLALRVREAGGTVGWALEGVPWFHDLFGRREDRYERPCSPGGLEVVSGVVKEPACGKGGPFAFMGPVLSAHPGLAVLHFVGIDHAGHSAGAESASYRTAANEAMAAVADLRSADDAAVPEAQRPVWMLGADHGHLPQGGHGGPESPVRRTTWVGLWPSPTAARVEIPGVVPAERLASTFAAILGVAPPAMAMGEPLALPDSAAGAGATGAGAATSERRAAVEGVLAESRRQAHRGVLLRALAVATGLVALGAALARRDKARVALAAALPALLACLGFCLLGPGMTLSAIRTQGGFMAQSTAATAFGAALGALLAMRWGAPLPWIFAAAAMVPGTAYAITAGSMGRSLLPDGLLLLFPASGLVPWGVVIGTVVACGLERASRLVARGRRRS